MSHLKKLIVPKTWSVLRRDTKFVVRPSSSFDREFSIPVSVGLRDMLKISNTMREVKYIINDGSVLINQKKVNDVKAVVKLFDVVTIDEKNFRLVFDAKGRLSFVETGKEESNVKPQKIKKFHYVKGNNLVVTLFDGNNFNVDQKDSENFRKNYSIGDSVIALFTKDSKEYSGVLKFEKDAFVVVIGGKYRGLTGQITSIDGGIVQIKSKDGDEIKTLKSYIYVIYDKFDPKLKDNGFKISKSVKASKKRASKSKKSKKSTKD